MAGDEDVHETKLRKQDEEAAGTAAAVEQTASHGSSCASSPVRFSIPIKRAPHAPGRDASPHQRAIYSEDEEGGSGTRNRRVEPGRGTVEPLACGLASPFSLLDAFLFIMLTPGMIIARASCHNRSLRIFKKRRILIRRSCNSGTKVRFLCLFTLRCKRG